MSSIVLSACVVIIILESVLSMLFGSISATSIILALYVSNELVKEVRKK